MCHALHLAADGDLPLLSPTDPPGFSVEVADRGAEAVARHVPGAGCLRYLGSATGCSCGFHDVEDGGSRARLVAYLGTLPVGLRLWLYDCWEGDWDFAVEEYTVATCADLLLSDAFAERRLITIVRE